MFGVAFGQIAGGAVSDIKGRRPVALFGLSIYFAAVVALTMVQSVDGLLNLRAVQAFGAGMTVVHRRSDGARLLFGQAGGADVCLNRHYPDGRTADCAYVRLDVAGFGRLAFYFRLFSSVFVCFVHLGVYFPAASEADG